MGNPESKPAGEPEEPSKLSEVEQAFADTDTDTSGCSTDPFAIADGRSSPDPFTGPAPREFPAGSPASPVRLPAGRSNPGSPDRPSLGAKRLSIDARLKAVATARRAMSMTEACRRKRLVKGFPDLDPNPTRPESLASFTGTRLHFPGGCLPVVSRSRGSPPNTPGPGGWKHGDDALPSCAYRAGVTEEERRELRIIVRRFPSELGNSTRAHDGYLELGWARCWTELQPAYDRSSTPDEVRWLGLGLGLGLASPSPIPNPYSSPNAYFSPNPNHNPNHNPNPNQLRAAEHERLLRGLGEAQAWRRQYNGSGAEAYLEDGLPPDLMDGAQCESWEYGKTSAGLPIFVDRAVTWLSAIRAARQQGLSPQQWGAQRVYWHERCLEITAQRHAAGEGNGQYIHIVDFEGVDVGLTNPSPNPTLTLTIALTLPLPQTLTLGGRRPQRAAQELAVHQGGCHHGGPQLRRLLRAHVRRPPLPGRQPDTLTLTLILTLTLTLTLTLSLTLKVRRPPLPCDQPPLEAGASLLGRRYLREGGRRLAVLRRAAHRALQLLALDRNDPRELAHLLRGRARGAARTDTLLPRTSIDVDHLSGDVSFVKMNMTLFKSATPTQLGVSLVLGPPDKIVRAS